MMAMRAARGMPLAELLAALPDVPVPGRRAANPFITGLALDSRKVTLGDCFVALAGAREHGLRHAAAAVTAGAVAVLTEGVDVLPALGVPVLRVDDLRLRLGDLAACFFEYPARHMTTIAVTGTNGKTTVAHLCADALHRLHGISGYFGTLGGGRFDAPTPGPNTTPDPITLQRAYARLRDAGCRHVALEASSHALVHGRLNGLDIGVAVFTGLGHDHLDFHGTLDAYLKAKSRLFVHPGLQTAVINADDAAAPRIATAIAPDVRCWRFSLRDGTADFVAQEIACSATGSHVRVRTPWGAADLDSALIGDFNVQNLLAALAALVAAGTPLAAAARALSAARPVRGRMELAARTPCVYVDYAHSPDSLERVLATLRHLARGRLICVFGCGGERDVTKRPAMGAVAERAADLVFVTADNPRGEDAGAIAADILRGMQQPAAARVELDRAAAIRAALACAGSDDVVLIAGKGHETTQTIGTRNVPFDDVAVVRDVLGVQP